MSTLYNFFAKAATTPKRPGGELRAPVPVTPRLDPPSNFVGASKDTVFEQSETGLTPEQDAYKPDIDVMTELIKESHAFYTKLNDNLTYLKLTTEQEEAIRAIRLRRARLDAEKLRAIVAKVNDANAALPLPTHLDPRLQQYEAGSHVTVCVDGNFPTTTTMSDNPKERGMLTTESNATVFSLMLLHGFSTAEEFASKTVRSDRVPTCVKGDYTAIPSASDYKLFQHAHVEFLADLFELGADVYSAVSDSNRTDFEAALYGTGQSTGVVLIEKNGSTLELHMPKGKQPVVAIIPSEHTSHIYYQALSPDAADCCRAPKDISSAHAARVAENREAGCLLLALQVSWQTLTASWTSLGVT